MHGEKLKLFNQQLERINKAPPYQGKLPQKINSLDRIKNLPFTCKDDLRQNFPYGFLVVSTKEIIHFHASSGSTGIPTLSFFTKNNLNYKEEYEARFCWMAGLRPEHTFQIMAGIGLCTAGWCAYRGGQQLVHLLFLLVLVTLKDNLTL